MNNDGYADFTISAPFTLNGKGSIFLIWGSGDYSKQMTTSTSSGETNISGFEIQDSFIMLGSSVISLRIIRHKHQNKIKHR